MRRVLLVAAMVALACSPALADWGYVPIWEMTAGYNTGALSAQTTTPDFQSDVMTRVTVDWTSDGSGNASTLVSGPVTGALLRVYGIPGKGDDAPTDNYDVTINSVVADPDLGWVAVADDLAGTGLDNFDVDGAVDAKAFWPTTVIMIPDRLQVEISGAGSGKSGRLILYIYRTP